MENSKLKAFIPLFYLVWSDDLVNQKEFGTLEKFILSQRWLSNTEQETLLLKITVLSPPPREVLNKWKFEIETILAENPSVRSLFDLSVLLSEKNKMIIDCKAAFVQLEIDLGISDDEVMADLGIKKDELVEHTAVEVGNIFTLGTKFSDALDLTYTAEDGSKRAIAPLRSCRFGKSIASDSRK